MYDILIKNGKIIDGQNSAPYFADVAIQGDEIVKIGKIDEPAGTDRAIRRERYNVVAAFTRGSCKIRCCYNQ